jgi:DNA-binding transcriptional ArsR family regulator
MTKTAIEADKVDQFDWSSVVDLYVHPLKVAIIEALIRIGKPLSATDLRKVFGGTILTTTISRHLVTLAKAEIVVVVRERRVRGAREKFYFFPGTHFRKESVDLDQRLL